MLRVPSTHRVPSGSPDPTGEKYLSKFICTLWSDESGQDIAEYAIMVAVILIIVVGTVRLIGTHANTVFSNVASTVQ
jgi:Flp pilus assembly pilin Flp